MTWRITIEKDDIKVSYELEDAPLERHVREATALAIDTLKQAIEFRDDLTQLARREDNETAGHKE